MATKDLGIALIVLALLIGIVVFGGQALFSGGKLVQAKQQSTDIAQAARLWKESKGQTNYTGLNFAAMASILKTSATLAAPYGGSWTVAVNTADATKFDITLKVESDISAALAQSVGNGATATFTVATNIVKITSS